MHIEDEIRSNPNLKQQNVLFWSNKPGIESFAMSDTILIHFKDGHFERYKYEKIK